MLTYDVTDFKSFSQKFYDKCINSIDFFNQSCSCGHRGCLSRHGYYKRSFITSYGTVVINILRVKCSVCNKTHAVLLSSMVPFSRILLLDQLNIIIGHDKEVMENNVDIDESACSRIRKRFNLFFLEFLNSERVLIWNLKQIIHLSLTKLKRQFMQVKTTLRSSSGRIILLQNILIS